MPSTTYRRILVPHDYSAEADQALRTAAAFPGVRQLVVLHVVEPFYGPADPIYAAMVPTPESLVPEQRRLLERRVGKVLGRRGGNATVRVLVGNAANEIVKAAAGANLIVMPTTGRTGLKHILIGSVAERVVRLSPVPVLTMRVAARRRASRRRE
jgi:nucleotide-binding universal stress UspA family protein